MTQSARPLCTARAGEAVRVSRNQDGSFAIGLGRIRVVADGEDMAFVTSVVEVFGRLAHLPEGEAALRRGDELDAEILIVKPVPPTEPANAWTIPDDIAASSMPGITRSGCRMAACCRAPGLAAAARSHMIPQIGDPRIGNTADSPAHRAERTCC